MRRSWSFRGGLAAAVVVAALVVPVAASAQGAFYQATAAEVSGGPAGSLIRDEAMNGAPLSATSTRILYRSTASDGKTIVPVSGVVIVSAGDPPAGGRPIVAWAHPTSGIVPKCAPSLAVFIYQQIQGLHELLQKGYVVVATDYPGLGTSEPHPYLVGVSEGNAVLDSIRAARQLLGAGASNKAALWGHSQGGQAVLYAADLAATYAPDLDIVGVAAAAPATEIGKLMMMDIGTSGGKNLTAMTLWTWNRYYGVPLDNVVLPAAIPLIDKLADICLESLVDMPGRMEIGKELQRGGLLSVDDITTIEPWKTYMDENTIGTLPPAMPVFIAQGTKDDTVDPSVTEAYMAELCAAGSRVAFYPMTGVGHLTAAKDSAGQAIAWMSDRFAGAPAPTSCPQN